MSKIARLSAAGLSLALCLGLGALPSSLAAQPRALRINDVTVGFEGNGGAGIAEFTVRRDSAGTPASVQYVTSAVSATAGNSCGQGVDFLSQSGGLNFAAHETEKTIAITVCGDTRDEPNETFNVNLHTPGAGTLIADGTGVATLIDDDDPPSVSIQNASINEVDAGATANLQFTVRLSAESGQLVRAVLATQDGSARAGACGANGDYQALNMSLDFSPGVTQQSVNVTVCGDGVREGNEAFQLRMTSSQNASNQTTGATGTITDNEPLPTLTINNVTVAEAPLQTQQQNAVFTVTLNGPPSSQTITVNFATNAGTATQGNVCRVGSGFLNLRPGDYLGQTGTLTFAPTNPATAPRTQTITVPICVDFSSNEPEETFTVVLSGSSNAGIANDTGTGTIR